MAAKFASYVRLRAQGRGEYCQLPETATFVPFEVDHVVARKHGGQTVESNLALACFYCNSFKGSNVAGFDPSTRKLTRLYHPRQDRWVSHFRWDGAKLIGRTDGRTDGRTAVGRTTIQILQINDTNSIRSRKELMDADMFRS